MNVDRAGHMAMLRAAEAAAQSQPPPEQPTSQAAFWSVRVVIAGYDVSSYVPDSRGVVVRHGRSNSTEQPNPNSAVLELYEIPDQQGLLAVGATLAVDVDTGAGWQPFFTGTISDIDAALRSGNRSLHRLVAVSSGLGQMQNRRIGDEPWPVELDGARMGKILQLAGIPVGTVDAGTVSLDSRDIDSQDALRLAQETAAYSFGVLVDERNGSVSYHDAAHRQPEDGVTAVLDASELRTEPQAVMAQSTLVNSVTVTYGPEPQGSVSAEDADSITAYGLYQKRMTTKLASQTDAQHIADTILALYSQPRWSSEVITLPLHKLAPARAAELAALPANIFIAVTGSPAPLPEVWAVWVEGIEDTLTSYDWNRTLLISDRYLAPVPEPPEPPEPGDCATFDWAGQCSTMPVSPRGTNGGLDFVTDPSGGVHYWNMGESHTVERYNWLDDDTFQITIPVGAETFAIFGMVLTVGSFNEYLGAQPHPDPWNGAGDAPDFCIGYDLANVEVVDYPGGSEPMTEWTEFLGDVWYPGSLLVLPSFGFQWYGGFSGQEAFWADGYAPPLGLPGCRKIPYGDYAELYPGYSRVASRAGWWEYFSTMFHSSLVPDPPLPSTAHIRNLYEIRLTLQNFRWSRAFY